jgi:hypothetical protein
MDAPMHPPVLTRQLTVKDIAFNEPIALSGYHLRLGVATPYQEPRPTSDANGKRIGEASNPGPGAPRGCTGNKNKVDLEDAKSFFHCDCSYCTVKHYHERKKSASSGAVRRLKEKKKKEKTGGSERPVVFAVCTECLCEDDHHHHLNQLSALTAQFKQMESTDVSHVVPLNREKEPSSDHLDETDHKHSDEEDERKTATNADNNLGGESKKNESGKLRPPMRRHVSAPIDIPCKEHEVLYDWTDSDDDSESDGAVFWSDHEIALAGMTGIDSDESDNDNTDNFLHLRTVQLQQHTIGDTRSVWESTRAFLLDMIAHRESNAPSTHTQEELTQVATDFRIGNTNIRFKGVKVAPFHITDGYYNGNTEVQIYTTLFAYLEDNGFKKRGEVNGAVSVNTQYAMTEIISHHPRFAEYISATLPDGVFGADVVHDTLTYWLQVHHTRAIKRNMAIKGQGVPKNYRSGACLTALPT